LLGLALWGSPGAWADNLVERGVWIALVVGGFILVYAWNFAAAPANLDNDQTQDMLGQRAEADLRIADIEAQLVPKLAIEFDPTNEEFFGWANVAGERGGVFRWMRVRPYSISVTPVKDCVARLVGVCALQIYGDSDFEVFWSDSLQLPWAVSSGQSYEAKNVERRSVRQFVDVAAIPFDYESDGYDIRLLVRDDPNRVTTRLPPGRYLVTVLVISAHDGNQAQIDLEIDWRGNHESLSIKEVAPSRPEVEAHSLQLPQDTGSETQP